MSFEEVWKALGDAIARERPKLLKARDDANAVYMKTIAPYLFAVQEAAIRQRYKLSEAEG